MSKPARSITILAPVLALLLSASASAQIENLRGQRLERMYDALDEIVRRTEARSRGPQRTEFGDLEELTLPGERPLRRLIVSTWNVMEISLTATIMTTPIAGFNEVREPENYRAGKRMVDGWLSTTKSPTRTAAAAAPRSGNPLVHCVAYLQTGLDFIEQEVQDCTYTLYKRERINGRLQPQQKLNARVQLAKDESGVAQLSKVALDYLSPPSHAGRRIVYRAGENGDKMLVQVGGALGRHLTLKMSPESRLAKLESQYSITDTSPLSSLRRLMQGLEDTTRIDPRGEVTKVRYYQDSKVGGRSCLAIVIDFQEQWEGLDRRKVIAFVDSETYIPMYLAAYVWPAEPGGEPVLQEEFVYSDMQFNMNLPDSDFQLKDKSE